MTSGRIFGENCRVNADETVAAGSRRLYYIDLPESGEGPRSTLPSAKPVVAGESGQTTKP
jgi:hypothetical protein